MESGGSAGTLSNQNVSSFYQTRDCEPERIARVEALPSYVPPVSAPRGILRSNITADQGHLRTRMVGIPEGFIPSADYLRKYPEVTRGQMLHAGFHKKTHPAVKIHRWIYFLDTPPRIKPNE